eukprot:g12734.t1
MTASSFDEVLRPRVCVIGAGASGLAAGRLLRDEGCDVTVLEKSLHVGGVWRYNPEPGEKAPMYRSLVTNLPKEAMAFFSLPFHEELQSFTTHDQVLDYLCAYADEHGLHPIIHLGCPVETVRRIATKPCPEAPRHPDDGQYSSETPPFEETAGAREDGDGSTEGRNRVGIEEEEGALGKWEVVYRESSGPTASRVSEVFDAVCVCTGHFDEPFAPRADGADRFRGTVMHAREYDRPDVEAFIGKRVLCVGSRSSGTDIAREVSSVADVVHVCDRNNLVTTQGGERDNIWWRPALERFEGENGVRFKDGEFEEVDTVVWCTGYKYSFPFLEGSGLLSAPVSERVHPLYEQVFHVRYPSLSFIGLPQSIVPFPMFEVQANAVASAVTGRASLPRLAERERWLRDEEESFRERSIDPASRGVHVLGGRQWAYLRRLLRLASGPGFVARGPIAVAVDGNGRVDDGRPDRLGVATACTSVGTAGATGNGAPDTALQAVLKVMDVKEAIYNDAGGSRSPFPGGPDDYRRREYEVDWESGCFSVSYADLKANGRLLRDEGCDVTVLEKSLHVGGVWRYSPEPREKGPMYRSLVTNLPKEAMAFFSLPFREELQSFTTHYQVLDYLCAYADEHKLHSIIHLGCPVETVRRIATKPCPEAPRHPDDGQYRSETPPFEETAGAREDADGSTDGRNRVGIEEEEGALGKWEVVYRENSGPTASRVSEVFDAVCVCTGHFDAAFTPRADGADRFRGTVMHAREYDRPDVEAFIGKRVLCVGAGYSGADVAREVSFVADVVHVCDRNNLATLQGGVNGNVLWRPALERFEGENGVRFKDGEFEEVDTVVWCTGYKYYLPFLEGSGLLNAPVSERVHPLYEQVFHVRYPSLSFIGLPQSTTAFPVFEVQANAVAAAISGRASLPRLAERERWLRDEEESFLERSIDPASRGVHVLAGRQWAYLRRLLRLASGPGFVARGPAAAAVGGNGRVDDGSFGRLGATTAPMPVGTAGAAGNGNGGDAPDTALQAVLKVLEVKEAIFNDSGGSRNPFPGESDDYRRREYEVDWESGRFSVSYADLKANGEGPSAPFM